MARYSDTVQDQYGNAVSGVQVSVYPRATPTVLATLTNDAGGALGNPVATDNDGLFSFNAATNDYILSFKLASATRPFHVETVNLNDAIRADLALSTGATLVGISTGGTLQSALDAQPIYPAAYASLQAAITAAVASGRPLRLKRNGTYLTTTSLTVTGPLTIEGENATITCSTAGIPVILATSGSLDFHDFDIVGASATYSVGSYGIHVLGTRNGPGVAPTFAENVKVTNVKARNVGHTAFRFEYAKHCHINGYGVLNVGYAGVLFISCDTFSAKYAVIDNITGETASGELNAYAISATSDVVSTDRVRDPVSIRGDIGHGIVRNIPTWQALDTHGGDLITIHDFLIENCRRAVFVTFCANTAATDVTVRNITAVNVYDRTETNSNGTAKKDAAFSVVGLAADKATGIVFENLHASGYGDPLTQLGAFNYQHADVLEQGCSDDGSLMASVRINGGVTGLIDGHKTIDLTSYSGAPTTVARCIDLFTTAGDNNVVISRPQMVRTITQPVGVTDASAVVRSLSSTNTIKFVEPDFTASDGPVPLLSGGSADYLLGDVERDVTVTLTGVTGTVTGTARMSRRGNMVAVNIPTLSGTSNATAMTITGMPANYRPAAARQGIVPATDNGVAVIGVASVATSGVITLGNGIGNAVWTGSGTKGVQASTISFNIQ